MLVRLTSAGVSGGAVYDGLVTAAAQHGDRLLISCDRRAAEIYQALGTRYELIV